MASFMQKDTVRYACTCGILKPIPVMYFCRHCVKLRCGYCVAHEVDSHYCSHCLELLPSSEARLKRNRCASCFDCPSCFNSLALRATTVSTKDPDDPSKVGTPRKMYYQACSLCRWTTRDVGLPDRPVQSVATSAWPQTEAGTAARVGALLEQARTLSILDRLEREQGDKKLTPRIRRAFHLSGLTSAQARKRAGLPPDLPAASTVQDSLKGFTPAVAKAEVEQLPEDIFTKPLDLNMVTTLAQRLAQPEHQPASVMDFIPVHKHLSIKRSQRCPECEHNVTKPEMNPCSIKFKILHAALFNIPCVSLIKWEPLQVGKESEVQIMVVNPIPCPTTISFLPHNAPEPEDTISNPPEEGTSEETSLSQETDTALQGPLSSLPRVIKILEEPRLLNIPINADVKLPPPEITITLPAKDDSADYDVAESGDTQNFQDDPKLVVWRRVNKVAIRLTVVPHEGSAGEDLLLGFVLKFPYMNRIVPAPTPSKVPTFDLKEPEILYPQVRVYVKAGKISGPEES